MKLALIYLNGEPNIGRGVGTIASIILEELKEHSLDFFDSHYISLEDITRSVSEGGYDFVMISASSLFYKQAVKLSDSLFDNVILLGGAHPTIVGGKILEECKNIDYICCGEGETFIKEFLKKYGTDDLYAIDNLGYRDKEGNVIINPIGPLTDLDTLPMFRYDIFNEKSVVLRHPLPFFTYVSTMRGCPFKCTYCCNEFYLNVYKKNFIRMREINAVIKEMQYLKYNYHTQCFYFGDEMLLYDREYVTTLLSRVYNEVGVGYGLMARVEKIDQEMVDLFKTTGCKYVGMGLECGDENYRRTILKRYMSNQQIIDAFSLLRSSVPDIMLTTYNMCNYPCENDEELTEATIALNAIIKPDIAQLSIFYPFIGTSLYDYCAENGYIDWEKYNSQTDYFNSSVLVNGITKEGYNKALTSIQQRVYGRGV
jgi:radical SAM superfamily enzyme YgiQ (UPF0313 family)